MLVFFLIHIFFLFFPRERASEAPFGKCPKLTPRAFFMWKSKLQQNVFQTIPPKKDNSEKIKYFAKKKCFYSFKEICSGFKERFSSFKEIFSTVKVMS